MDYKWQLKEQILPSPCSSKQSTSVIEYQDQSLLTRGEHDDKDT